MWEDQGLVDCGNVDIQNIHLRSLVDRWEARWIDGVARLRKVFSVLQQGEDIHVFVNQEKGDIGKGEIEDLKGIFAFLNAKMTVYWEMKQQIKKDYNTFSEDRKQLED